MNISGNAVLLLRCQLGDKDARPLSAAQFRNLSLRLGSEHLDEHCRLEDLCRLGYDASEAHRILQLLSRHDYLHVYLNTGRDVGIFPITCACDAYPAKLKEHHAMYEFPVLFVKGDISLLQKAAISVVGSRNLLPQNRQFAETAGRLAAQEGYVLVSGGAKGADTAAQEACLAHGGSCVVFLPDSPANYDLRERVLYVSEFGYDLPFSSARALHRNLLIHMMGEKTLAAQSSYGRGGTWQGCTNNLKHGWSDLFICDDGSQGSRALIELGATPVSHLSSLGALKKTQCSLFD